MEWVPSPLATAAAWAVTATFAWAAVAKSLDRRAWFSAVVGFGFNGVTGRIVMVAVPLAELSIVALFLWGRLDIGATLTLVLVASFSGAIVRARAVERSDRVPCGCFGGARRVDYRLLLARNAGLAALAALVLLAPGSSSLALPRGTELLPTALIVVAGVVLVWMTTQATTSLRRR